MNITTSNRRPSPDKREKEKQVHIFKNKSLEGGRALHTRPDGIRGSLFMDSDVDRNL